MNDAHTWLFQTQRFSDPTRGKNLHNVYLTRESFVVATAFSSAFVIVNSQPESSLFVVGANNTL